MRTLKAHFTLSTVFFFCVLASLARAQDPVERADEALRSQFFHLDTAADVFSRLNPEAWRTYPASAVSESFIAILKKWALEDPNLIDYERGIVRAWAIHYLFVRGIWNDGLEEMAAKLIKLPPKNSKIRGLRSQEKELLLQCLQSRIDARIRLKETTTRDLIASIKAGSFDHRVHALHLVSKQVKYDAFVRQMLAEDAVRAFMVETLDALKTELTQEIQASATQAITNMKKAQLGLVEELGNGLVFPDFAPALSILDRAGFYLAGSGDPQVADGLFLLGQLEVALDEKRLQTVGELADLTSVADSLVAQAAQGLLLQQTILALRYRHEYGSWSDVSPCLLEILEQARRANSAI